MSSKPPPFIDFLVAVPWLLELAMRLICSLEAQDKAMAKVAMLLGLQYA